MQTYNLGQITKIKTGKLDANAKVEGGKYPFFTCSKEISWIDTASYDCECVLVAGNGDLNVKYYKGKFDAYQRTYIIESNGEQELDMKYLYYFIEGYMETLRGQTIGGVIQYIKMNNLTDIQIPLPPITTQHAIAGRLDQIQKLIELKKQALTKTDELAKSIFLEMFGDPMANEKGLAKEKLGNLCNKITDGTHKTPIYKNEGVVFLSAKNISKGKIDLSNIKFLSQEEHDSLIKRAKPEKGDILLAKSGTIGISVLVDIDIDFSIFESLALIKYKRDIIKGQYLNFFLNSEFARNQYTQQTKGNSIKHLHIIDIKSIDIILPPLPLQQRFAEIITEIEAQKSEHNQALTKLEELYQAEMQRSFSL